MIKVELHPNFDIFQLHNYCLSTHASELLSFIILGETDFIQETVGLSELIDLEIITTNELY